MSIGQNLIRAMFVALLISSLIVSICQQGVAGDVEHQLGQLPEIDTLGELAVDEVDVTHVEGVDEETEVGSEGSRRRRQADLHVRRHLEHPR